MARTSQNTLSVTAVAKNEMGAELAAAGGDIDKLGKVIEAAEKKALAASQAAAKVDQERVTHLRALPREFSHVASGLGALGAANDNMGSEVAKATGHLAGLASVIATGGPVGIAIAAASAAVALGSTLWDTYQQSTRNTEAAIRSLDGVLHAQTKGLSEQKAELEKLNEQIRFFGKSQEQIRIVKAAEATEAQKKGTTAILGEVEAMKAKLIALDLEIVKQSQYNALSGIGWILAKNRTKSLDDERAELQKSIEVLEQSIAHAKTASSNREQEIDQTKRLIALQKEHDEAIKRKEANAHFAVEQKKLDSKILDDMMTNDHQKYLDRKAKEDKIDLFVSQRAIEYNQKAEEANKRAAEATQRVYENVANSVSDAFGNQIEQLVNGEQKAGKAAALATKEAGKSIIRILAAEAAARAFAANNYLPGIGIAVGAAFAAAAFGAVMKWATGFAGGGVVRGGQDGRDSVPAMLTPRERVLTVEQNELFERLLGMTGGRSSYGPGFADGGRVGGGGIGSLNLSLHMLAPPPNQEDRKKMLMGFARDLEDMVRAGQLRLA